ncbi:S-layer homology domain-containing protein [Stenomitos frigidus]|uniref:S-layer protein n=1 Tax=Stenomitos frigidus ULC18 TaxID=2107698 RepID=A0A2T1EPK6_9CYAN|nr:S-layer homology domain-containing protein [Stenomitos frigidus]PSB34677.1 S-layer protein [Stenomitos frigidus ULC18]
MTTPPDPQSDGKRLSTDELIAVFVALTSIGVIFFWSIGQKDSGLSVPLMSSPTASVPSPTPSIAPSLPAVAASPIGSTAYRTAPPSVSVPIETPANPAPVPVAPFIAVAPQAPTPSQATSSPPAQAKQFADVPSGYWAGVPIAALSAKGILDGFPDGNFQPNKPITRAEFAEIIRLAFNQPTSREALKFNDLQPNYWAIAAIDEATQTRFMSGFPNGSFQPNRQIPRLQVLLALATGLNLQAKLPPAQVLSRYQDAAQIPKYATDKIAAATEAGLVLNDADPKTLNPTKVTTRAEVAALVYKALRK